MADATAARRAMAILRHLAAAPGPVTATALARDIGLPRSSTYHLLSAMAEDGFVVHYPEDRRWGIGVSAFELGTAYLRQDPLQRLAAPVLRTVIRRLPDDIPALAHCAVLHGRESLYVATSAGPRTLTVVAEVGVRLPASLTASGRAMLAALPAAQVRALFPDATAFVDRTGRGPMSPTQLTRLLAEERSAGFSVEEGFVTEGFSSIAATARDRAGRPAASIAITLHEERIAPRITNVLASIVMSASAELTRRLGGRTTVGNSVRRPVEVR